MRLLNTCSLSPGTSEVLVPGSLGLEVHGLDLGFGKISIDSMEA